MSRIKHQSDVQQIRANIRRAHGGLTLIWWLFWSQQLFSYESDDGMRITARGLCCVSITKKMQEREIIFSGNLAGITNNVQHQLSLLRQRRAGGRAYSEGLG